MSAAPLGVAGTLAPLVRGGGFMARLVIQSRS
jgi:hypothetical protein